MKEKTILKASFLVVLLKEGICIKINRLFLFTETVYNFSIKFFFFFNLFTSYKKGKYCFTYKKNNISNL